MGFVEKLIRASVPPELLFSDGDRRESNHQPLTLKHIAASVAFLGMGLAVALCAFAFEVLHSRLSVKNSISVYEMGSKYVAEIVEENDE